MMNKRPAPTGWKVFQLDDLIQQVVGDSPRFYEFLRASSMSLAMYYLPAGSKDMQPPHAEDEVYIVIEGRARVTVDGKTEEAVRGSILFVAANTPHSFFDIEEDLTLIAFFGPRLPPVATIKDSE